MSDQVCSIEGCGRPVQIKKRGWCNRHYLRWRRHGDPEGGSPFRGLPLEEYFSERVEVSGDHLKWKGSTTLSGHGQFPMSRGGVPAHVFAWEKERGPVPRGTYVDHACHEPSCVKVSHLRLASPAENSRNRRSANKNNLTGVRNVQKRGKKFRVRIRKNGVLHNLGTYSTLEEASEVAKQKRKELFGEFAGRG